MPQLCAILISNKMATLHELRTVYSLEDAYAMIDIIRVDAYNKQLMSEDD